MTILLAWFLADFISGLVHWWEDRAMLGVSRFKFLNAVRADNERHHRQPGYLIRHTWWGNINTTAPFAWVPALLFYAAGAPLLVVLTSLFLGFGNLVHRWAHEKAENLPSWVFLLQRSGLFISASHHSGHHLRMGKLVAREDSQIRFCVMTSWLNPVLDTIRFWRALEYIFRVRRRT